MKAYAFVVMGWLGATVSAAPALPSPPRSAPAAWAKCTLCHTAARGKPAGIGPGLWGVAGARAGARPGFAYSAALRKTGLTWNRATLTKWLADTQAVAPGSTMPNPPLTPAERDALVAYMLALK